jgi:hypothetical protein
LVLNAISKRDDRISLTDLLSDGVRGICSALADYGIRVKDKAFSKD